jgi:thiol-disulfide isomerase/thioredoxin
MSFLSTAQSAFDTSTDKENGALIFKGSITFDDLQKEPSFIWYKSGVTAYKPDIATIELLKNELPSFQLVVLMGTWCDDSQNLIPKLYKVLQETKYPMRQLSLYGVNRVKECNHDEHILYSLKKVPTIILFRNNKEVGRIVENVNKSIEADLKNIITTNK